MKRFQQWLSKIEDHLFETWDLPEQMSQDESWIVPASTRFKRLLLNF